LAVKKKTSNLSNKRKTSQQASKPILETVLPLAALLVFLVFISILRLSFLDFGLDRDEGAYTLLGEVLRNGGIMYVDGYEMKPPALFYLYALINSVFGYTIEGLHTSVLVFNFLSALGIYFLIKKWINNWSAAITGICFSIFAFNPIISGFAGVAEHYMNFILIAAAIVIQKGILNKRLWLVGLAGMLFTLNVGIKQNGIFFWLIPVILLPLYSLVKRKEARDYLKLLGYFLMGSAAMTILLFLPVFIQGSFNDFWYWVVKYPKETYTSSVSIVKGYEFFKEYLIKNTFFMRILWILGLLGSLAYAVFYRNKTGLTIIILSLVIGSILSIAPGLRFYGHYWLLLAPVLAIGNGLMCELLYKLIKQKAKRRMIIIPVLLYAIIISSGLYNKSAMVFNPKEIQILRMVYGDNPFTELRMLSEHFKKIIAKNDKVAVLGGEPQVYNYLNKPSISRHIFMTNLVNSHERQADLKKEFIRDVETARPEYIYFIFHPYSWVMTEGKDQSIYNWAYSYVQSNYKPIGIADLLPGQAPYMTVNEQQLASYQPRSDRYVYIYKRLN
jgi:4-amino-4-deoxy-L-arabinose transferase-like glycosyltransferase